MEIGFRQRANLDEEWPDARHACHGSLELPLGLGGRVGIDIDLEGSLDRPRAQLDPRRERHRRLLRERVDGLAHVVRAHPGLRADDALLHEPVLVERAAIGRRGVVLDPGDVLQAHGRAVGVPEDQRAQGLRGSGAGLLEARGDVRQRETRPGQGHGVDVHGDLPPEQPARLDATDARRLRDRQHERRIHELAELDEGQRLAPHAVARHDRPRSSHRHGEARLARQELSDRSQLFLQEPQRVVRIHAALELQGDQGLLRQAVAVHARDVGELSADPLDGRRHGGLDVRDRCAGILHAHLQRRSSRRGLVAAQEPGEDEPPEAQPRERWRQGSTIDLHASIASFGGGLFGLYVNEHLSVSGGGPFTMVTTCS